MGKDRRSRIGLVVLATAVVLAAVGGSAAGLGAPAWLAGAVAAVSALAAGTLVDRVFRARDARAAARDRLGQVLADLTTTAPGGGNDVLGLLRADRSPAPFRGRRRELQQLTEWCANEQASPVMIVSGPAGVGKSRLALEFASSLPNAWTVGWLRGGAGADAVSVVRAWRNPAAILVDDADGRADLALLLDALAEDHDNLLLRVILLTRSAIGLRAVLRSRLEERHEWIAVNAPVIDLQVHGSREDRERWFGEAVEAFAATLSVPAPAFTPYFHPGRAVESQPMIALQAQALLAVLGKDSSQPDPRALSFGQIAEALINHEKRRWRATASTWLWGNGPLSETLQARSITALTLLGSATEAEAEEVLRRVPELRDASSERLSAIAAWVLALYPADPVVAPRIRPDMVGEWFVVSQLTANPDFTRSLRAGLTDAQAARALGFLAHAADRLESAMQLFDEFASGDIRRQFLAAAQAAMTGEAGRPLLDHVIAQQLRATDGWTVDQLTELDRLIPRPILLLTHTAIADLIAGLYRGLAAENPAVHQPDLATALNNLGGALYSVGRYPEALAATEEAVTLRRGLAAENPAVHQPDLATELNNLGVAFDSVGRYPEALAAAKEAVAVRRGLAAENPAVHQTGLATELDNLGNRLDAVGRYSEALAAAEEAVALRRGLVAENPAAHQPDLATALTNLGIRLDAVGRYPEALAAAEEAVILRRALAAENPAAHQMGLALALDNLGNRLGAVGRYPEALAAAEEAVSLYRALAADNPAAHQPDLAAALTNLGNRLDAVGRSPEALTATEEAVGLWRGLAAGNPAAHQTGLAAALYNLGTLFNAAGRYPEALAAAEEAVALRRALAADNPAAHQPDLAGALNNLGIWLDEAGRYPEALAAAEEAVSLYRAPVGHNPAAHQPGLATALHNLGNRLDRAGKDREALAAKTASVRIYRELALRDPDLYQKLYRRMLSSLRRDYDLRGKQYEAIIHDLADPPSS